MTVRLLDERSSPSLRDVLGVGLARAAEADFAIGRIRLFGIDLTAAELGAVRRCRVLIGRLDVETLTARPPEVTDRSVHLRVLRDFLESGRLEVRAAGLQEWAPDFSILRGIEGLRSGGFALFGAHYFSRPYPIDGAVFTCFLTDPRAIAALEARFEEAWRRSYNVDAVIRESIDRFLD